VQFNAEAVFYVSIKINYKIIENTTIDTFLASWKFHISIVLAGFAHW